MVAISNRVGTTVTMVTIKAKIGDFRGFCWQESTPEKTPDVTTTPL